MHAVTLAGVQARPLPGDAGGRISAQQVVNTINPEDVHYAHTALVCLENTTNRPGGACYSLEQMAEISQVWMHIWVEQMAQISQVWMHMWVEQMAEISQVWMHMGGVRCTPQWPSASPQATRQLLAFGPLRQYHFQRCNAASKPPALSYGTSQTCLADSHYSVS
jgi:hypothetical protein